MKRRIIGVIVGALCGVLLGGGTGIVGAFGGLPGVYVFVILGAVIGFFATPDISRFLKHFKNDK